MTPPFSWAKHLLSWLIVIYLLALLAVVLVASHYSLEEPPASEVPPPTVVTPDFTKIIDVEQRKQAFFDFLRPLVAYENRFYRQERERLLAIIAKVDAGTRLGSSDNRKLLEWTEVFNLDKALSLQDKLVILQRRINVIPEAMVLAQAAMESAWGRSRFARQGNNYFGQWCYTTGCGLVPQHRNPGAQHEIKKFDSVRDAVSSYFRNINTHRAYQALRDKRWALDQAGETITGYILVGELGNYSQRGQLYTEELRLIIRGNQLE